MQRYISKELFHFAGRGKSIQEQYNILKLILNGKKLGKGEKDQIKISSDYSKSISSNNVYVSDMVCFCDIPLSDLKIHMNKYSSFGLSFSKIYLLTKGASPVWYISKNSIVDYIFPIQNAEYHDSNFKIFTELKKEYEYKRGEDMHTYNSKLLNEPKVGLNKALNYYLDNSVFPFFKFFDAEKDDTDNENYYMEREWRLMGCLDFEDLSNIHRVVLPSSFAKQFREDFPEYFGQITFVENN